MIMAILVALGLFGVTDALVRRPQFHWPLHSQPTPQVPSGTVNLDPIVLPPMASSPSSMVAQFSKSATVALPFSVSSLIGLLVVWMLLVLD